MNASEGDQALLAWRSLLGTYVVVSDAAERALAADGAVPLSWFEALSRLEQAPEGALRMQDLAGQLLLSRSGVTRLADRLEAAGFVERRHCGTDRRGTFAALTAAGRDAIARARPLLQGAVERSFVAHLSEDDARALTVILNGVTAANGYVLGDEACPSVPSVAAPSAAM